MVNVEKKLQAYVSAVEAEAMRTAKVNLFENVAAVMSGWDECGDMQDLHLGLNRFVESLAAATGGKRQLGLITLAVLNRLIMQGAVSAELEAHLEVQPAPLRCLDDGYRDNWNILELTAQLSDARGFDVTLSVSE